MHRWQVGQVEVVRIEDEDFALPSDRPLPDWAVPGLAASTDEVRVAFAAFVIVDGDRRILVDPWLANDFPRDRPDAADHVARLLSELDDAGLSANGIDTVVNTHFDGVGWNTRPDPAGGERWVATFPHARYLYPRAELDAWRDGAYPTGDDAFVALEGSGRLQAVDPPEALTPRVRLDDAPGHAHGHVAVTIESAGQLAMIPGHLFLTPFQVADPSEAADLDPELATASRRRVLDQLADADGLLLTTLLGGPGGGIVRRRGDDYALEV